jgi:arylsulfatase A-like enzyme
MILTVMLKTLLLFLALSIAPPLHAASRPNVLLFVLDDMNGWAGHLGVNPQARTPHMDRLAARGITFTRAYAPAPLCNPSRAAMFSGMRPSSTGIFSNEKDWRPLLPPQKMLVTQFRQAGWWAGSSFKHYHGDFARRTDFDDTLRGKPERQVEIISDSAGQVRWGRIQGGDEMSDDRPSSDWCISKIQSLPTDRPFFLSCGFSRPHLPYQAPQKYFDQHPLEQIRLPETLPEDQDDLPEMGKKLAASFTDQPLRSAGKSAEAVQGFLAAIASMDHELGRVLDALDASPHRENTLILLVSDHGQHTGQKQRWSKFTLWEESCHVPFIWVVPGVTKAGTRSDRVVETFSLYPTLCELASLPVPDHVEGRSIVPLLRDPKASWDHPAITSFKPDTHTLRDARWRYIRYQDGGEELYDHNSDPHEWHNLANQPEHRAMMDEMAAKLPKVGQ